VYFGPSAANLQFRECRAGGRTDQRTNVSSLRKILFTRKKRADRLAALLVEIIGGRH
jgi:hypothetical protein